MTDDQIEGVLEGLKKDKQDDADLESAGSEGGDAGGGDDAGGDDEGGGLFDADSKDSQLMPDTPIQAIDTGRSFKEADESEDEDDLILSMDDEDAPLKAQAKMKNVFGGEIKSSKSKKTAASSHMPSFGNMTMNKRTQDSMRQPYNRKQLNSFESFERELDKKSAVGPVMSPDIVNILRNIDKSGLLSNKKLVLNELSDSIDPDLDEGSS